MEFYSLAVCSKIWGTLLQVSHSRIMDRVATMLAQPQLSLAHTEVLYHRSKLNDVPHWIMPELLTGKDWRT